MPPATVATTGDTDAVKTLWQTGRVRKPQRTLVEAEDDELVDEIEKMLKGGKQ